MAGISGTPRVVMAQEVAHPETTAAMTSVGSTPTSITRPVETHQPQV